MPPILLSSVGANWLPIEEEVATIIVSGHNKRIIKKDSFFASFALGWLIMNGVGLASYPIDTVAQKDDDDIGRSHKVQELIDAVTQILKNEGAKSLFKPAGWCKHSAGLSS
ncbi:hypothetical protein L6452_24074 [Arctium lappa]|uniref:Uncharacterized protein n=1 Tax=Arctium lappa TaxID=4217 RepID=A0ACB9A867_ARCLA|nr:hypothetical protein L6452_24074 [Arctium lappa]